MASAQEQRRVEKEGSCAWKKKPKKKRKERKSQCSARVSVSFFSAFLAVICLTSAAKWSRETEIPLANPALSASAGLRGACDEGSRDSVPAHDCSSWEGRKRAPKKNIHTPKKSKQTDSDFIYISCRSDVCRLVVAEMKYDGLSCQFTL